MKHDNQSQLPDNYWADLLRPLFKDRKVVVVGDYIVELAQTSRLVRELGASSTFLLGTLGKGAGELPRPEDGEWIALSSPPVKSLVDSIHVSQETLRKLPQNALVALDRFDPDHSAVVLGTFFHEAPKVAGRKSFMYRKPEWIALEDKTIADELWELAHIPHTQSAVVPIEKDLIVAAVNQLDQGNGTVWSSDAKEGFQGGAEGTRWIRNQSDLEDAVVFYKTFCDRIRIMPFLEGIPCSIHGIVFDDYVAALRPVEMVVLQKSNSSEFFYSGTSTFWDPNPDDRENMRAMAKQLGKTLRAQVNFRGIFTLDGVMTKGGFRPTEINPRSGAGIKQLVGGLPHLPLQLLANALSAGFKLDYKPKELEELLVQTSDRERRGGTWTAISDKINPIDGKKLVYVNNIWRWAKDHEQADGSVVVGSNPLGSFVRLTFDKDRIQKGQSVSPLARDFWKFVNAELGGHVGQLEAAKNVR